MKYKIRLKRQYDKRLKCSIELLSQLELLSRIASEIYGEEIVAEICSGNEIEFRITDANGTTNADCCIRLEDLLKS